MQNQKFKSTFLLILLPLLIPGLLVAAWRCLFRSMAERKNVFVETVLDFEEMRQLSREEGWKLKDLFAAMKANGASSVALSEDTLASLESEGRITVLSSKEIRKLSLDEGLQQNLPDGVTTTGSLWVHSEDSSLLDRIEKHLSWKILPDKLVRIHRNFLLINKSAKGFKERVGLGFSEEYFKMADQAGLGLVVRVFNYPGLSASSAAKIISSIPSPASVSALLFAEEEMLGHRGDLSEIIQLFSDRSYRIGWIEFNVQAGIRMYLKALSKTRPFVRVHSISREEIDLVYDTDRAIARWVRATKDRSMKMLYIRCFFQDDEKFIANLVDFNLDYLRRIASSLNDAGFSIATSPEQRINEPRHMVGVLSGAEKVAVALALLLGLPLLIKFSYLNDLDGKWFFSAAIIAVVGYFVLPVKSYVAFVGLIGAFSYSSLGVILAFSSLKGRENGIGLAGLLQFFLLLILPSILGGILISGLYSEIEYLLKFSQFRGVKLAFVLPVLWIVIWSLKEYGKGFINLLNKPITPIMALFGAFLGFGLIAYILRSGNLTIMRPSAIEDGFRTFLENTLVARPRTKEFMIGYPAAALFIFFYLRRCFAMLPLMAIFVQMGQVSVLNTLCHFHSPLSLSLLRIFNGFWVGVVVSVPIIVFTALAWLVVAAGSEKKKAIFVAGYLGFGNFGDELLWQTFARRFKKRYEDFEINVLLQNLEKLPDEMKGIVTPVSRKSWFRLFEALFCSRALVFPGGGILQASTSFFSLVYYSVLILLARLVGAKVLLPAQGFGPWGGNEQKHPRFFHHFARLMQSVEYLSLRDEQSLESLKAVAGMNATISADLAFLEPHFDRSRVSAPAAALRVAIVLRDSEPESERIARLFLEMTEEVENLTIIPVSMQSGDEKVWQKVGWSEELFCFDEKLTDIFSNCDLVVSMRLHGCIVATAKALPWIGIAYDPKVSGFAQACGWKYCFPPEKIDRKLIETKMNLLAVKKIEFSEKLARKANEFSRRSENDFEAVVQLISE